jgi:hypothetical protein
MVWLARIRSFTARHRATYWVVVVASGMAVTGILVAQSQQIERARASWGATTQVWVATADAGAGQVLHAQRRQVPVAMVPHGAVTGELPPAAIARQAVAAGEVVVAHDVGAGRLPLLAAGQRAVAIPADDNTITVAVGDRVDVVARGQVLAGDGVVVDVSLGAVVVGVPADDAAGVAAAALDRIAVVVLRPG